MLLGHIFATVAAALAGILAIIVGRIMLVLFCAFIGVLVAIVIGWKRPGK